MPKGSRRLPGGRTRKPLARGAQAKRPLAPDQLDAEESDQQVLDFEDPAPPAVPARPVSPVRDARRMVSPAPAPVPATAAARFRAAAGRPAAQPARRGPSTMDLAIANYRHIRTDLARIGILAVVMLAVIVALSFVLR